MPNNTPPLGTKEYLVALRDTCNSILSGDNSSLLCKEAIWSRDQDGSEWATVVIASKVVDPWLRTVHDGTVFRILTEDLDLAGFKDVEVRTEW